MTSATFLDAVPLWALIPITIAMAATGTQDVLIGHLPGCRFSGERHLGHKPSGSEETLPAWERAAPLWARRRWYGWP